MVISAVTTANLFNGLNTNVWTAWVFFAVFIGVFLVVIYTVSISSGPQLSSFAENELIRQYMPRFRRDGL